MIDCDNCDNDSNFDNSASYLNIFPRLRGPCAQAGCAYRENFDNIEFDEMNKLGHRTSGKHGIYFEEYYMCDLCRISFCNTCTYMDKAEAYTLCQACETSFQLTPTSTYRCLQCYEWNSLDDMF